MKLLNIYIDVCNVCISAADCVHLKLRMNLKDKLIMQMRSTRAIGQAGHVLVLLLYLVYKRFFSHKTHDVISLMSYLTKIAMVVIRNKLRQQFFK